MAVPFLERQTTASAQEINPRSFHLEFRNKTSLEGAATLWDLILGRKFVFYSSTNGALSRPFVGCVECTVSAEEPLGVRSQLTHPL